MANMVDAELINELKLESTVPNITAENTPRNQLGITARTIRGKTSSDRSTRKALPSTSTPASSIKIPSTPGKQSKMKATTFIQAAKSKPFWPCARDSEANTRWTITWLIDQ